MTHHTIPTPRLSGSILYTLISVVSLTLITACGGGGLKLDANLNITDGRLATLCGLNPFVTACADFADERKSFIDRCVADDETVAEGLCDTATTFVCTDNPFPILCDREEKYRDAQKVIVDACEAGTCDDTQIVQFCEDNPYHARCIGETAYDTTRDAILATCGTATIHEHCHTAVVPVCMDNPFDIVCYAGTTYEDARVSTIATCSGGFVAITNQRCVNAIAVTCVGDGIAANPGLCEEDSTVSTACGLNIFNTVCDNSENYLEERREFCANPATASDNRCPAVVTSTCTFTPSTDANNNNSTGNPFDTLCGTTYEASRNTIITACTTDLRGRLCTNATTFACTANPFHALCYDPTATEFQTARSTAVTNCGDGTNVITTQLCIDAVALTCEGDSADVFNAICITAAAQPGQVTACSDNDDATRCYLAEQINLCAEGREVARCTGVSTNADIMACIVDPFATACVDDSGFDSYLVAAQGIRYEYCRADGVSATDELCTSYRACDTAFTSDSTEVPAGCGDNFDTAVRDTCATNPFDPVCTATIYNSDKQEFCSINTPAATGVPAVNNLFHANCTADYQDASARNTFCLADPFHASCNNNTDFANGYANAREDICAGDTPHDSCVNTSLLEAVGHPTGPTALADTARYDDSFLIVTIADGQDNAIAPLLGDIEERIVTPAVTETVPVPEGSPEGTEPTTRVVTPESTTVIPTTLLNITVGRRGGAGSKATPNFNKDGYAFFQLERAGAGDVSTRVSRHVAILPTTNLGAPLTAPPANAVWPGHFSSTATLTQTAVDFYVDFALRRVGFSSPTRVGIGHHLDAGRGWVADRPAIAVANKIRIDVQFDPQGRLYGFIEINDDNDETRDALIVNGLIGQEGLVAVGYSNRDKGGAGGFTASNPLHRHYVEAVVPIDPTAVVATGPDSNGSLVNYEDWIESAARPKYDRTAPRQSEFLQTDNRRIPGLVNGQLALVGDFNSATNFRSPLLRGEAKNGFAVLGEADNFYAGVFNTASLGAPIRQTQGSAIWRGYLLAQDGTATTHRLFDLDVTFSSNREGQVGTLGGTVINDRNNVRSLVLYTIEGRFNARGVISGDIIRSVAINTAQQTFTTNLSGLIGQKGAIGVFASNSAESKFAGGFVARPSSVVNANYDVWARTTPLTTGGLEATPKAYNHWLEGGVAAAASGINGQSRAGITDGSLSNLNLVTGIVRLSDATYKLATIGGSASNGVAFYTGIFRSCTDNNKPETCVNRRQFYSGLFSQTDLGKPVAKTSGHADWVGQLVARQNIDGSIHHRYGDIVLRVNFTPSGGTIAGSLHANPLTSPGYSYDLANVTFNEDGFVRGNVNTRTTSGGLEPGFLTGLIGERGMVGSFIAPNVAGGFVAVPGRPRRAEVTYEDWLYHTQVRGEALTHLPHNVTGRLNEILLTDPGDPNHFISYGNSRSDDGRERIAVRIEDAWSGQVPTGLTGGYSALHTLWNPRDGLGEFQTGLHRAYHAGIHPDTNVGSILPFIPVGTSGVVANWKTRMSIIGNKTFDYKITTGSVSPIDVTNVEFIMEVHLANRSLKTPRHTATYQPINGHWYNLQASWDDRGVITGTFQNNHANFPDADVTGLIGTNGAVAAIVSKFNRTYGYAGGFIACPTHKLNGTGNCK